MTSKAKSALSHGAMSYLFSLGMTLTLLGVTGLLRHGWMAAFVLLGVNGALALISQNRRAALGAGCLALFVGLVWLIIGGMGLITEVAQALLLHMSGLTTALPLVGAPFTAIICLLCTAVSWFVTQRSAGAFPALILLVLSAVLLWLGSWTEVLICLLPAVAACVTLLLRAGDEHTSTLRVLPLALVTTLIAFTGVWMGGATSRPMKELADEIRQRIYDTFFFTQPRDVFTLASEGYYPQGLGQLGGPADPREEPVMAVITPRKAYLRGVVKNVYTGRTWVDDIGGRRYLMSASRFDELRTTTFDQDLPLLDGTADSSLLSTRTLQVRMLRDSASTLFVPQRLRSLAAEGSLIPYFNVSSEVFATSNLKLGDVWTVEAALFTGNDAGVSALINAAAASADARWEEVCSVYLQLHENIDARVYELTAQVTADAATPYDKAVAIQQHLAANYAYTLDVAEQSPSHDFVSTFLIDTREGYCTYFASAMTVMCRMAGLPARYVEGYVAYPDGEGLAIVTGKEGHAWTEVYFSGFGWVTFDATPTSADYTSLPPEEPNGGEEQSDPEQTPEPSQEPTATPEPSLPPEESPSPSPSPDDQPENQPVPSEQPTEDPSVSAQEQPQPDQAPAFSWGMLWLLLLALMALRAALVQPALQAWRKKTEFGRWLVWTQAVHDALRRKDLRREMAETPAAFFERVERGGKLPVSLQPLADAENLMFYGHAAPLAEETRMTRECFTAIWRTLNAGQKLIFQLQRICLPAKRFDITRR